MHAVRLAAAALVVGLGGCAARHLPPAGPYLRGAQTDDAHVPPFATAGWAPFSRDAAIAIARREWRVFGSPMHVESPAPAPPPDPTLAARGKPER